MSHASAVAGAPSPTASASAGSHVLAALAVVPILATVYQTLVLTDVTADVIRKGIEADSYQMIWTNVAWGVATLYGLFGASGSWPGSASGSALACGPGLVRPRQPALRRGRRLPATIVGPSSSRESARA